MRAIQHSLLLLLLLAAASTAEAASFIVPTDDELLQTADAVVVGNVEASASRRGARRAIETATSIRIAEVIKGDLAARSVISVVAPGGVVGDRALVVPGRARYRRGERALVFLKRSAAGEWMTLHMALGKFGATRSRSGQNLMVRDLAEDEVLAFGRDGSRHEEVPRDEAAFLQYLRARAGGRTPGADYFRPNELVQPAVPEFKVASGSEGVVRALWRSSDPSAVALVQTTYLPSAFLQSVGGTVTMPAKPARWSKFDAGASVAFRTSGSQAGVTDSTGSAQRALAAWTNDGASNVSYTYGGTTTVTSGFSTSDNIHSIIFNDPSGEIAGSWTGSGTIATGLFWATSTTNTFKGETFYTIYEGDVIVQDGVTLTITKFDECLTHELGHTLGFRHSNSAIAPSSTAAIMTSTLVGTYGTNLQAWDQLAVSTVYGSGAVVTPEPVCTAPAITTQPLSATIASGATATLSVVATGTGPLTYQWYRGTVGTTTYPVGTNSATYTTPALTSAQTYWVRVTNGCGGVNSTAATIGITATTACTAPLITTHPASKTILAGQTVTFTVAASGTGPLSYRWYRGSSGTTTYPVGTNSASYTTPALSATERYWVQVRNACGYANSRTATATVCVKPAITAQPVSVTIAKGTSTRLSVSATGTTLSYQWYRGARGDTRYPVGTNSRYYTTPLLSASTQYWVRVRNACGYVHSNTATVTVR